MNIKPILIGGIVAYLITRKSATTKSKESTSDAALIIRPGYSIKDCKVITITDEEKASIFAFKSGLKYNGSKEMDNALFGNPKCFDTLEPADDDQLRFINDTVIFYIAGAYSLNKKDSYLNEWLIALETAKTSVQKLGKTDTSKWLTEKDIPQIIEENK